MKLLAKVLRLAILLPIFLVGTRLMLLAIYDFIRTDEVWMVWAIYTCLAIVVASYMIDAIAELKGWELWIQELSIYASCTSSRRMVWSGR